MELVRTGEVDCIVVKDFSRFGRNMVETGYFLQMVFPLFRTRFIAVSDGFDSSEHKDDTGGLEVTIKLLVSEQYSKDLSRKIKSARHSKALKGESISKLCIHGYKKVGNGLVIDEPAAKAVRLIFDMGKDGSGFTEIAARLYKDKYPTPSEYKQNLCPPSCIWSKTTIQGILLNEQYIGTYISGKTKRLTVGSKKPINVDESEWIKIENHHPAIIDNATFKAVTEKYKPKKKQSGDKHRSPMPIKRKVENPLQGKVFCGHCGHTMRIDSSNNKVFKCNFTSAIADAPCYRHKIPAAAVSEAVLTAIRQKTVTDANNGFSSFSQPGQDYEQHIAKAKREKMSLYERLVGGEISAEEFKVSKTKLDSEIEQLSNAHLAQKKAAAAQKAEKQLRELLDSAIRSNTLTYELVEMLIDRIIVFPGGNIKIEWKNTGFEYEIGG